MRDDVTLVAEALANSPEGFAPIIEQYKDAMFGVAFVRLRNFHDAEDLTQEAFVEGFQRLGSLRDPNRLGAWLRSIVIHLCINHLNRLKKTVEVKESILHSSHTPQSQMDRRAQQEQVVEAIGQLSKVQRETVTLFYVAGYSLQEIARIQEVPVGTIKSRLHEARQRLKKEMIEMISDTLKEEAPKEDFAEQVFKMLSRYPECRLFPGQRAFVNTLKDLEIIGKSGLVGFQRALASPHWPTRAYTAKVLRNTQALARTWRRC
jgi:RNA polymerase sigma-70 factor (ECF subfamily)